MGLKPNISGAKGGSSTHTPVESPDTLRSISYFQVEDLLSEGEIGGLVNGLQSVKLDGTPVANADGSLNFTGVSVQIRTGTQDQASIPGYGAVKNEIAVSTELKQETPWVRQLTNVELSAFALTLQVDALQKTNTRNGDITGSLIQFAIDVSTDGAAYETVFNGAFDGKASGPYQRTIRIDLPKATTSWNVRVRRLTANANSATVADTTRVVSMTEIIDAKLRYPNSAYVAISGDASQFSNVPQRSYVCWGRLIRIPSNYDPATRSYSGVWDGSFKVAWTNNPAWILYDMVTQDRFGLGSRFDPSLMDKWELYRIGQYCDEMVDNGTGGQEPRFTCTCYLQTRADAFRLIGDMASVFRGVSYWMGSSITTVADMPQDPVYTFNPSNVIGGKFSYQASARKTRFTTAQVTYNDPANSYKQAVEYVQDAAGIARYGIQPTEFVAFGCTSQSQAHRAGLWALVTSQLETDSVSFAVGLEGLKAAPGQIVTVQDPGRAGATQSGRITVATATVVTVDRAPDVVKPGDTLTVLDSQGVSQTRTIASIDGRDVRVAQAFTDVPVPQSVWHVESEELATQTFRILNVKEDVGDGKIQFTISAIQHNASKFAHIDSGAALQVPPVSRLPVGSQKPVTSVLITSHQVIEQGIANNVMTISWSAPADGAANYKVEWQKGNGQWIQAGTVSTTSVDVQPVYTGTYVARVTALNNAGSPSIVVLSAPTEVTGKTGAPPALTSLKTTSIPFGITLDWTFPDGAEDTQTIEIYSSSTAVRPDDTDTVAAKQGDFAYPGSHTQLTGLSAGASLFFWGRIIDKAGNVGPWYPDEGAVNGQSIADPRELQDYWGQTIGKSALTGDLLTEIEASTAAVTQLGQDVTDLQGDADQLRVDVDAAGAGLQQEREDREAAVSAQAQALVDGLDNEAQSRAADLAAEAEARGAAVNSEAQARQDADSSLGARVDTVSAATDANTAAIQDETTARTSADAAEANERSLLATQMRGGYDGSDLGQVTSGLIAQEKTARTSQYESLAQQMTLLSAGVGEQFDYASIWYFTTGVDGWAASTGVPTWSGSWLRPPNGSKVWVYSPAALAINGDEYTQVRLRIRKTGNPVWYGYIGWQVAGTWTNKSFPAPTFDDDGIAVITIDEAWSGTIDRIRVYLADSQAATDYFEIDWVAVGRPAPGASSSALAAEQTARATADAAEATARQSLSTKLTGLADPTNADLMTLTSGLIYDERTARSTADGALATSISQVQAQASDNAAAITAEQTARSSADVALGQRVDSVSASFGAVGRWQLSYLKVTTATPQKLKNADGTSPFDKNAPGGAVYECEAQTKGTSTLTSAVVQFTSTGTSWTLTKVFEAGTNSNNPEFFIDADGDPAIRLYNHTSLYMVDVLTTKHNTRQTSGTVNSAAIASEATARADADTANAKLITNLTATVAKTVNYRAYTYGSSVDASMRTGGNLTTQDGTIVGGNLQRSWNVYLFNSDGSLKSRTQYDIYGDTDGSITAKFAADLNALAANTPVLVATFDEPASKFTASDAAKQALIRCGATSVTLAAVKTRCAYILLGLAGSGEGAGIERFAGSVVNDASAWVDLSFAMVNGRPAGLGGTAQISAAITTEQTTRAAADLAMAQDISLLGAHNADKSAFVLSQATTKVDANTSLGSWMNSVTAGAAAVNARVDSEQAARATADSANASAIQTVQASVGSIFRDAFDAADASVRWKLLAGTNKTYSDVASADSIVGGSVMRVGDGANGTYSYLVPTDRMAFDPNKLYRIRVRLRVTSGTFNAYVGLVAFGADKVTPITTAGATGSYFSAHYTNYGYASLSAFTEVVGYFKGRAAAGASPMGRAYSNPAPLVNGTMFFAPVLLLNYSGAGLTEVDYVIVEDAEAIGTGLANSAAITAEQQARADADSALASRTSAIEASVTFPVKAGSDSTPAGANTRKAGIYTYSVARVDGDLAEAVKTETLSASIGTYGAQIQTIQQAQATADGKISASQVVKVQVAANGQTYLAGIAVGVDYSGGDVTSQVLVNAATFAVFDASNGTAPLVYPLVVQNNQVLLNQALIGDGWITNAMIGNQIKSTAVNAAGQPVWEINKTGTRYVRGDAFTITEDANGWRMTNAAGIVVIEMGVLS